MVQVSDTACAVPEDTGDIFPSERVLTGDPILSPTAALSLSEEGASAASWKTEWMRMSKTGLRVLLETENAKAYLESHRVGLQQQLTRIHISQEHTQVCICELPSTCVPDDKLHLDGKQNKGE